MREINGKQLPRGHFLPLIHDDDDTTVRKRKKDFGYSGFPTSIFGCWLDSRFLARSTGDPFDSVDL